MNIVFCPSRDIASCIIQSDQWKSALRNTTVTHSGKVTTPLRKMIRKMPSKYTHMHSYRNIRSIISKICHITLTSYFLFWELCLCICCVYATHVQNSMNVAAYSQRWSIVTSCHFDSFLCERLIKLPCFPQLNLKKNSWYGFEKD